MVVLLVCREILCVLWLSGNCGDMMITSWNICPHLTSPVGYCKVYVKSRRKINKPLNFTDGITSRCCLTFIDVCVQLDRRWIKVNKELCWNTKFSTFAGDLILSILWQGLWVLVSFWHETWNETWMSDETFCITCRIRWLYVFFYCFHTALQVCPCLLFLCRVKRNWIDWKSATIRQTISWAGSWLHLWRYRVSPVMDESDGFVGVTSWYTSQP